MTRIKHIRSLVEIFEKELVALQGKFGLDSPLPADAVREGRRTRPLCVLLAAEAAGGEPRDAASYAVAVEFTHKASVLRDDIVDGDEWRDGKPAFHVAHSVQAALAVSDVLWTHVIPVLADEYPEPLLSELRQIMLETHRQMALGQLCDLDSAWPENGGEPGAGPNANYLKTGSLVAAAFAGGALCAHACPDVVELLTTCGAKLGEAFQLLNDVGNLIGSNAHYRRRKVANTDLRMRRRGPLFEHVLREAEEDDRGKLMELYALNRTPGEREISLAREIFIRAGAPQYGTSAAREFLGQAHQAASRLPESEARTTLMEFCTSESLQGLIM